MRPGGAALGAYRDPLGGRPLVLASLPLAPCSRRRSSATSRRRTRSASRRRSTRPGAFLDPLIVVRGADGGLWTPNGRHRLAAAKVLGLRQITALVSPDESLAYRILALNTEKAHNLKDKSLEVDPHGAQPREVRTAPSASRSIAAEFEAPELLTLGIVYEHNARFAGGAYSPFLKKVDRFADRPLSATPARSRGVGRAPASRSTREVSASSPSCRRRGCKSPYLRNYVVARINPVRFHKAKKGDTKPPMTVAQASAADGGGRPKKFDTKKVSSADLAWVAAGAESSD